MTTTKEDVSRMGLLRQVICTIIISQTHTLMGTSMAFGSYFTTEVTRPDSELQLSAGELAWVGSAFFASTFVAYLITARVGSRVGAKELVICTAPLSLAGWLLIGFGPTLPYILAGRVLTGLNHGLTTGAVKSHVGEISSVHVRGTLLCLCNAFTAFGLLLGYGTAALLPWRLATLLVGLVPLTLQVIGMLPFPNSGKWLITHGRPEEAARRSIRFYQGSRYDVDQQVKQVRQSLGQAHQHNPSARELLRRLLLPHHLKPVLLLMGQITFFVFTGGFAASVNASVIFAQTSGGPYEGAVIVSAVRVLSTLVVLWVVEKFSRTRLLGVCAALEGLGCLVTGVYFYWEQELAGYDWMVMLGLVVLLATYSVGISPVTWIQVSEILPNAIRAPGTAICLCYFGLINFVLVYTYPLVVEAVGTGIVFWGFAVMNVLQTVYAFTLLIDTRGKSLEEIQNYFQPASARDETADPSRSQSTEIPNGTTSNSCLHTSSEQSNDCELANGKQMNSNGFTSTLERRRENGRDNVAFEHDVQSTKL